MSLPEIDRALDWLEADPVAVYVALDDWEGPYFRSRFSGSRRAARLAAPVFASRLDTEIRASVLPGDAVDLTVPHRQLSTRRRPASQLLTAACASNSA